MKTALTLLALGSLLAACANDPSTAGTEAGTPEAREMVGTADTAAVAAVTVEPKTPGEDFADAEITDWTYAGSRFDVAYDSSTYQLGEQTADATQTMCANSDKGQHIHLIVDNEPYDAYYTSSFEKELPDGEHDVLAFLSRSYHESIKTEEAHRAVRATVKDGAFASAEPITDPMLFYSRPKGTYTGKDAEELLLDFYPVNAELGDDFQVKAEIDGDIFTFDEWQPYVIKGLPMGENTITLSLVDGEGQLVDAPQNPVSRTFTLVADPLPN